VFSTLVLALVGLSVPIGIAARKPFDGQALLVVLVAALGWLIIRRQPGNRIGLLLIGFVALFGFYEDAANYAVADYHLHGGTLPLGFPAALIASELWSVLFLMPPLIILLFPDGALPPRWRMVARAYLTVCARAARPRDVRRRARHQGRTPGLGRRRTGGHHAARGPRRLGEPRGDYMVARGPRRRAGPPAPRGDYIVARLGAD